RAWGPRLYLVAQVPGPRRPRRERRERGVEPTVGEHCGVDAAREVAELGDGALQRGGGCAEQILRPGGIGLDLLERHPEIHAEREQALLRAVVKVALDLS